MIEPSQTDQPLPKIPYSSKISITLEALKKACNQIKTVSDYITLTTTQNRDFIISGKGDSGESSIIFERGMEDIPELEVKESSESTYSLEYLQPFLKALKVGLVTLEYSSTKPLKIEARLDNISKLFFYVAPRVES